MFRFGKLAMGFALGVGSQACLAQSWNNLRNDYRIQESDGFSYQYIENGAMAYMPRLDMGIWNVSYFDWNMGASNLYAVGHQMQPSAPLLGEPAQTAVCQWTSPADGNYVVRYRLERNSDGYGVIASLVVKGEPVGSWELLGPIGVAATGYVSSTLAAGETVAVQIDPVEITSADAINFELAIFGPCQADLNHDGFVDDSDFVAFAWHYDRLVSVGADFNDDGLTEDADFVTFVAAYDALLCD